MQVDGSGFIKTESLLKIGWRKSSFHGHTQISIRRREHSKIQALLEANGLAAGKDHQFKGRYDAEKNAVIISLKNGE